MRQVLDTTAEKLRLRDLADAELRKIARGEVDDAAAAIQTEDKERDPDPNVRKIVVGAHLNEQDVDDLATGKAKYVAPEPRKQREPVRKDGKILIPAGDQDMMNRYALEIARGDAIVVDEED